MRAPIEHAYIAGNWVATASRQELVAAAVHDADQTSREPRIVFDANGHGIALSVWDRSFQELLDQADVIHADGGFLVTLSRFLCGKRISERSPTTDMIHDFARAPSASHLRHFLLGADEFVNANAVQVLQTRYPDLKICGRRNGFFSQEEEAEVIATINEARPDILWVGMGKPREQAFCIRNKHQLNAAWIITAGGCFNYITGDYSRAPEWMQAANMEWLHRMATRPRALAWRYITTSPVALWATFTRSNKSVAVRI